MALEGNAALSGAVGAGVGGLLGGSSQTSSFGYGVQGGSSYESGGSNSWAKTFGSEASAKDIERTAEANQLQYELWKQNANYNKSEAQLSREWQEYMSNTAYQRAVKDLVAAGLNPVLAAMNTGASTPSGATASSAAPQAYKAQTFADSESGGSSYNVGGSNNYGININTSSGKSQSLIHDIVGGIKSGISSLTNSFKSGGSARSF